ncbi:MAG: helix-turn-helix domain-containing protein, partial [Dehalococcoidia bacterium]|nr:helix-turn-helix domain-containing protein [Dehalococcoidia bacterium]
MSFTVAELALAVNKSETYVRQHIRRKHLNALRHGRKVTVSQDEAVRWARDRGLQLVIPARVSVMAGDAEDRTARMVVLSLHPSDGQPFNLFTHIRHRRKEALGPWARNSKESWTTRVMPTGGGGEAEELRLHTLD